MFYGWNIEYEKKNIYLSLVVLAAGVLNVILNALFIPDFGYIAAAYTTAVSYFAMAVFAFIVSKKVLKIYCVPLWPILKILALLVPFVVAYYFVIGLGFWSSFMLKILAVILAGVLLIGPNVVVAGKLFYRR
ncbi:polysaccharide biosynthesis C-terminal domain-containing protein [Candidatus Peregrinibacteria bacterium]|nr:polysaccharide biosynthesis C-terminal domain-containing protein [Candidatus Peregrinibacteria bacterium]